MPTRNANFAARLRALRQARGLTQKSLAALAGVSEGCIRQWEQRRRAPSLYTAVLVAEALGVPIDETM